LRSLLGANLCLRSELLFRVNYPTLFCRVTTKPLTFNSFHYELIVGAIRQIFETM
jgi:hypothetical protein